MGEDAAAVDVGDDDHRAIDGLGKAHVGNVAGTQVDLRRRTGAFDEHAFIGSSQPLPGLQHRLHRTRLVFLIVAGIQVGGHLAVDDHLRLLVRRRLEQHRIEVGVRLKATGQCLQSLGTADLAAVDRHRGIEGHILRLEGRHTHATALQNPAQRRHQRRFTGIGGGPLDHQCIAFHRPPA